MTIDEKIELCRELESRGILSFDQIFSTNKVLFFDFKEYVGELCSRLFIMIDVNSNRVRIFHEEIGAYRKADEVLNLLPHHIQRHIIFNLDLFT